MRVLVITVLLLGSASAQNMVYPLNVGDRWQYFYFNPPIPLYHVQYDVLADTMMPNLQHYAMVTVTQSGQRIDSLTEFYRQDGNKVFRYSPSLKQEQVFYDFSRPVPDTAGSYIVGKDTIDVFLSTDRPQIVLGALRHTRDANHVTRGYYESWTQIHIVDSIGPYYIWYPVVRLSFQSATISGRVFGTIVSAPREEVNHAGGVHFYQNYPNPFNGTTRIPFDLSKSAYVSLDVFDLLGRRVCNVAQGFTTPGKHQAVFDSRGLPSGLYICRLSVGSLVLSRAMILLR